MCRLLRLLLPTIQKLLWLLLRARQVSLLHWLLFLQLQLLLVQLLLLQYLLLLSLLCWLLLLLLLRIHSMFLLLWLLVLLLAPQLLLLLPVERPKRHRLLQQHLILGCQRRSFNDAWRLTDYAGRRLHAVFKHGAGSGRAAGAARRGERGCLLLLLKVVVVLLAQLRVRLLLLLV